MHRWDWYYRAVICPDLLLKHQCAHLHQVPRLDRVTVHLSFGAAAQDRRALLPPLLALELWTGQHPQVLRARRACASFGLRTGVPLGGRTTLRGTRALRLLEQLVHERWPREDHFQPLSVSPALGGRLALRLGGGGGGLSVFEAQETRRWGGPGADLEVRVSPPRGLGTLLSAWQIPLQEKGRSHASRPATRPQAP